MPNDFIVRPKCTDKKEDRSITMTIRLERELQEQYDDLSAKSGRSRNELMSGLRHLREIKITINRRNAGFFMSNFIYFYVVRSCILSLYVI